MIVVLGKLGKLFLMLSYCQLKSLVHLIQVTAYAPVSHGSHEAVWQWQILTDLPSPSGMMEAGTVVPTLKALTVRVHENQDFILAAGDEEAVVISPSGSILTSIDLPARHTHAFEDFSNDGQTDLILVTSSGVYGFVQTRQPSAHKWVAFFLL